MLLLTPMVLGFCVILLQLPLPARALDKPWLIPKDARFRPDGEVVAQANVQMETGTYHGVQYRFRFTDGSGTFAGASGNTLGDWQKNNWKVICKKDLINDEKSCAMHIKELWILVTVKPHNNAHKQAWVEVGKNHYPGSSSPYTFFLLNGDMELHRNRHLFI